MVFFKAGEAKTASGKPLNAVTITRSSGDGHRFAVADRDAYTGVIAYWHDQKKAAKQSIKVKRRKKRRLLLLAPTQLPAIPPSVSRIANCLSAVATMSRRCAIPTPIRKRRAGGPGGVGTAAERCGPVQHHAGQGSPGVIPGAPGQGLRIQAADRRGQLADIQSRPSAGWQRWLYKQPGAGGDAR